MNRQQYRSEAMKLGYSRDQLKGLNSQQLYALIMARYRYGSRRSMYGSMYGSNYGISRLDESERRALMQYLKK